MHVPMKEEMEKMRDAAWFLEQKGYKCAEGEYGLSYENGDIRISAYFPPMEKKSQLDIEFIKEMELFPMRWIIFIATGRSIDTGSNVDDIVEMLKYLKNNYLFVTNYTYCQQIETKVDEYVTTHFIQH